MDHRILQDSKPSSGDLAVGDMILTSPDEFVGPSVLSIPADQNVGREARDKQDCLEKLEW